MLTTYDVTLTDGVVSQVTADHVVETVDPILGDKIIQFWIGDILVIQWPAFRVEKYEEEGTS